MPRGFRIRRDDSWVAASRTWRDQYIVDLAASQPELTLAQIGADYVQPPITSQAVSAIIRRMRAATPRRRGRAAAALRYIPHDLSVLDQLRRRASEQGLSIPALAATSGLPITRVRQLCTLPAARMWVAGARRNFKDIDPIAYLLDIMPAVIAGDVDPLDLTPASYAARHRAQAG